MLPEISHGSQSVLQTSSGQSRPGEAEVFLTAEQRRSRSGLASCLPGKPLSRPTWREQRLEPCCTQGMGQMTPSPHILPDTFVSKPPVGRSLAALPLGIHWARKRSPRSMSLHQALIFFSIPAIKENFALKMINNCESIQQSYILTIAGPIDKNKRSFITMFHSSNL